MFKFGFARPRVIDNVVYVVEAFGFGESIFECVFVGAGAGRVWGFELECAEFGVGPVVA